MMPRKLKDLFYRCAGPFMFINGLRHRYVSLHIKPNPLKVQLGPGQKNYFDGWVNVDANMFTGKCDIWADLRNSLPFRDESVDIFYSHHVIEHLPNIQFHFKEMYRCLKPGGKIRIGGPNGDMAIKMYLENNTNWFSDFPERRESIGGKFENFIFCKGEHLTILTWSYLQELVLGAGFKEPKFCQPIIETNYPQFIDNQVLSKEWESTPDYPHTIIIEAEK